MWVVRAGEALQQVELLSFGKKSLSLSVSCVFPSRPGLVAFPLLRRDAAIPPIRTKFIVCNAMASTAPEPKRSFFKAHILPALFIFLIPGFSAWFFSYAEGWMDRRILSEVEGQVQANGKIPEAEKARILTFYRQVPVSRIMASSKPEAASLRAMFAPSRLRYATFRWMKRISWTCLVTVLATFVIVGVSVKFSFRSHSAQYVALRIGWPVLRTSAAIQVLGQAILAVALSFWVTAILTQSYFLKLIGVVGLLSIGAVMALLRAIFAKVDDRCEVEGELVAEADAPTLWQRVRELAARLNTAAPDQIIVGIAPSFFVTEHPITLGSQVHQGRTLYLSLPLLKVLDVDEADAVLGHELAHFSGDDTLWSRKISPLTGRFALYLMALSDGLSLIVANFMHLFWKLYSLSISRLSREREFRADQIGSTLASKEAMKRALVKTTCYCEYRADTERAILEKKQVDRELNLALQLEQGYPAFLASFVSSDAAASERVPHPFDTHPTLNNRLAQLGFDAHTALGDPDLREPAAHSWYQAISTAQALEERMWASQQKALQTCHSQDLAWRLMPKTDEEAAIVREHFPDAIFRKADGTEATLTFDRLQLPDWNAPIFFKDIIEAKLEASWGKQWLILWHQEDGKPKPTKARLNPALFTSEKGNLLAGFSQYYSRHKTAEARSE